LELHCRLRPLFGRYNTFIVDEADSIPRGGQIRLLQILERLENSIWIFTSNEDLGEFEERFLSRVRHLSFSTQGLLDPATRWLADIAAREGIPLDRPSAEKIVRSSKNNLRSALRSLELCLPAQQLSNCP
jgi:DNA polymerase III delta prime subunit